MIMLSDLRHSAQCQTESAGLSLPWSVFEGSSPREDQRLQHQPQPQRELRITSLTFWGICRRLTRFFIAEAHFIDSIVHIPNRLFEYSDNMTSCCK